MKRTNDYHEVVYHIDGYNTCGGFISEMFEKLEDAVAFWGSDGEWQNALFVAEHFYSDCREQEVIKDINTVPIHELFRH